jgi:Tfp pilus assembly protein PilV
MTARLRHRLSPRSRRDSRPRRDYRLCRDYRRCVRGLTLLEVILALIILGGALVAVGELIRTASRSARDARDATSAQVIADSLMSEIAAGVVPPQPIERQADPIDPDFVVSVMVERPTQAGLIQVMVLVERADAIAAGRKSEGFRLVRWMLDPGVELAAPATGE